MADIWILPVGSYSTSVWESQIVGDIVSLAVDAMKDVSIEVLPFLPIGWEATERSVFSVQRGSEILSEQLSGLSDMGAYRVLILEASAVSLAAHWPTLIEFKQAHPNVRIAALAIMAGAYAGVMVEGIGGLGLPSRQWDEAHPSRGEIRVPFQRSGSSGFDPSKISGPASGELIAQMRALMAPDLLIEPDLR